jgi:hypothetical protein
LLVCSFAPRDGGEEAHLPLYPDIEPFATGRLRVSDLHELYYEQTGTPDGKPAVFLHGGPGGGLDPYYRRSSIRSYHPSSSTSVAPAKHARA